MDPKFKSLQTNWYNRLQEAGFSDAEDRQGRLKSWSSKWLVKASQGSRFENKRDYYMLACQFLHTHKFANKLEKLIWFYHSEGEPLRTISHKLSQINTKTGTGKDVIAQTVNKLKKIMIANHRKELTSEKERPDND